MKGIFYKISVVCVMVSFLAGCSCGAGEGDKRVAAQVNNYRMSAEDLRYELDNIPYDELDLLETKKGREQYMDRLLEKEVLLQEAQRLGLDREKDFMKSIESYWEQALLKLLLQRKSREIAGAMHVYGNEIEEYYRDSGEKLPLSKVEADIERTIRQEKETEAMDAWIKDLKKKSYIKIDEDIVKEVLSAK